ncbi:MAG: DUF4202 family protein [Nanoarchaeota archaeon]|nr:DUF4202 family protein [Nanoarchaeota archaeon]
MLDKVKQFVKESFENCATGKSVEHFERTVYWIRQLKPNADEAILIAAYAHDIARAFRSTNSEQTFKTHELNDPEILEEHQKEGAKIMADFLEERGFEKDKIERIANMILKHEIGGDEESVLIKDADSISYLEINAPKHIKKLVVPLGKDKVERKIRWMFERISSEKAKQIAGSFYKRAIDMLESG